MDDAGDAASVAPDYGFDAASKLRDQLNSSLLAIAERTDPRTRCIILSGGVDTCAILAAAAATGVTFAAAITVLTGADSPDREFATRAAASAGLPHHIVEVTSTDLVDSYLPQCVKELGTFDGMTLRNSLVVAAAMRKASELGFTNAIVGDGADELFGGYSFMWGMHDNRFGWRAKRDTMCRQWTFATAKLAAMHRLASHSPYTEPPFVAWALECTGRAECIGEREICLVLGGERLRHACGKVVLREAYETISSWRRKDPIEVGSGITVIGHDPFWADLISDAELATAQSQLLERGYVLKNKEHLANFRAFEAMFGADGATLPTKRRLPIGQGCAGCCFEIGDAAFCEVCGAYPAQRGTKGPAKGGAATAATPSPPADGASSSATLTLGLFEGLGLLAWLALLALGLYQIFTAEWTTAPTPPPLVPVPRQLCLGPLCIPLPK